MKIREVDFSVIDLETTGTDYQIDKIVEFASVDFRLGGPMEIRTSLINPQMAIPIESMAIHHITNKAVASAPVFEDFLASYEFKAQVYVAHQADFDYKFLPKVPGQILCTRRLAMKMWPDLIKSSNSYLRYFLGLEEIPELEGLNFHRAAADAIMTSKNLEVMLNKILESNPDMEIEPIIEWAAQPILQTKIQFGKHKGKPWSEIPRDYLDWMKAKMTDLDSDTLYTLNYHLNEHPF